MPAGTVRTCIGCGQTDDHPKHRYGAGPTDPGQRCYHLDCHAAMGCETCKPQIVDKGDLRGDDFRAQLIEFGQARDFLIATESAEFDRDGLLIEGSPTNG